jgi:Tfp pilus assembly protein PilF
MNRHVLVSCLALALFAPACGGGATKPPEAPAADPSSSASTTKANGPSSSGPSSAKGTEGPAAASSSGDVTKGIEALKAGDDNGAKALFEVALQKNPKQADAHYYLGVVYDHQGNKLSAEKEFKEALTLQPDLAEAAANLTAIYVEAQRYDEAIAVAKKALEKNPRLPDLQLNYAIALGNKGDQAASQKAFDEALKQKPNDAQFLIAYAQQLAAWKKRDEALDRLKQAMKAAGDDAALLGTIGFELRQTVRAPLECITAFDKAIALKDNADFRTNRALCKHANKDKPGALADLQAAVAKEPEFPLAHYWLGWTLHEEGKFPEAVAEYERYLKLSPKGPMAKAAEAKIALAKDKKNSPPPKK